MKRSIQFITLSLLAISSAQAQSFLPLPMPLAKFAGTHWSENGGRDRPLTATMTLHEIGKGAFGTAVELRIATPGGTRQISPLQWIITPQGDIADVWFGENHADVKQWIAGSAMPSITLEDMRVPATDDLAHTFIASPEKATEVEVSDECWLWKNGPVEHSIRLNPARDMVRYATLHEGNSNFVTLVLQRGVGIVRFAIGSGAHRDGFQLNRVFEAVKDPESVKDASDVAQLFASLPSEAMPSLGSLSMLTDAAARKQLMKDATRKPGGIREVKLDKKNGYLAVSSDTDGEGDVIEAALWKRKSGALLFAIHVKHWTAGPEDTRDVRLFEFANGTFRCATFDSWNLPEPRDFHSNAEAQTNLGTFIAGDWQLPKTGTMIRIRPELEDDESMLDNVKCTADQAFELRWKGDRFERATVRR